MTRKTLNGLIDFCCWGIVVSGVVMLLSLAGHCSKSKKSDTTCWLPEGCVTQYTENPLMYQAVTLSTSPDAVSSIDGNLNLRVKPLGTYMLYDESILLCGMPLDKFQGKGEPFVLIYERQSHRAVQGIGCHNLLNVYELIRVDEMKTQGPIQ
jgi:hypothetical protein